MNVALAANLAPLAEANARFPLVQVAFSTMSIFESGWDRRGGLDGYVEHQRAHVDEPMERGPAFGFFKRLLEFNVHSPDPREAPLVHVHVVSRQDPDGAGRRRFDRSLEHYGLAPYAADGLRHVAFLRGKSPVFTLLELGAHLFLSADRQEVKKALAEGVAAAHVVRAQGEPRLQEAAKLKIAFDAGAVLFDEEAETIFRERGLAAFVAHEQAKTDVLLARGPFHGFLLMVHALRTLFPRQSRRSPLQLALVTSQPLPSQRRVRRTLQAWDVRFDRTEFFGEEEKGLMLKDMRVTIFFDGDASQVASARRHGVPAGHVPRRF